MARETKYRVWDLEGGTDGMFDWDLILKLEWTVEELFNRNTMIPMQYTGLKDKKGKEIYEGDIVTYSMLGFDNEIKEEYNNQFRGFVVYSDCQFKIQYSQSKLSKSFHYLNIAQNIEVVGNEWENFKLLK